MWVALPRDLSRATRTMRTSEDARFRPFHGVIVSVALLAVNVASVTMRDDVVSRGRAARRRTTVGAGCARLTDVRAFDRVGLIGRFERAPCSPAGRSTITRR